MFNQYFVYYDGRFVGTVMAMSENSAKEKGEILASQVTGISRSASAYSGLSRRLLEVQRR